MRRLDPPGAEKRADEEDEQETADRILSGLVCFACGDAVGLPWEGRPPAEIVEREIQTIPHRDGLTRGGTSDDTAFTLVTASYLVQNGGVADSREFLRFLAERAHGVNGGPTTSVAIRTLQPLPDGNTNGAAMRAIPIGWAVPIRAAEARRSLALALSRATHRGGDALVAAGVIAACSAWALAGTSASTLTRVAIDEAVALSDRLSTGEGVVKILEEVSKGNWVLPERGVSLNPGETVGAALYVIDNSSDVSDTLLSAVRLGGDTDTVAALAGGLLGCKYGLNEIRNMIPWLEQVKLPPENELRSISRGLASLRRQAKWVESG